MTKPKFTPDPPPYLKGMPIEKAFPLFVDWVIRQDYRKEDWWPKDYENRIQALEQLSPYCIGEWIIADAAHVDFGYEAVDYVAQCSESEGYDVGSSIGLGSVFSIGYSEPNNRIVISGQPKNLNSAGIGAVVIDASDGSWVYRSVSCTRSGHKIVSTPGTSDQGILAIILWACGSTGNRTVYLFDMSGDFSSPIALAGISSNIEICAERDADMILIDTTNNTRFWLVDKTTAAFTNLQIDGAWTCVQAAGISSTSFLTCVASGGTFGFSPYTSGTVATPSVTLGSLNGETPNGCKCRPIVVGTNVFWLFDVIESNKAYIVKTDFSGNTLQVIPQFDTNNYNNTRTGQDQLQYRASNNSIYYTYGETLWRYSLTSGNYFTCDAPIDPIFTSITDGRSSSFVRIGDYHWDAIIAYNATADWGYEKIESSF